LKKKRFDKELLFFLLSPSSLLFRRRVSPDLPLLCGQDESGRKKKRREDSVDELFLPSPFPPLLFPIA